MPNGGTVRLGNRLRDWLLSIPGLGTFLRRFDAFLERVQALHDALLETNSTLAHVMAYNPFYFLPEFISYIITGHGIGEIEEAVDAQKRFFGNPSATIGDMLNPENLPAGIREALETLGALVYDSAMSMILSKPGEGKEALEERIRQFMGSVVTLSNAPGLLGALGEITTAGVIETPALVLKDIYWNLGLGFVTWQMTSPAINASIAEPLSRYYNKIYRPARFSVSQALDLYAASIISYAEMKDYLAEEGWRDIDIDRLVQLSYRPLSLSTVMWAWQNNIRDRDWTIRKLRQLGYSPDDIDILFEQYKPTEEDESTKLYRSTLLQALSEGLIGEAEFRQYAHELGWSEEEINLRLELSRLEAETKVRSLAKNDIRNAYLNNKITEQEARHWLSTLGFTTEAINVLIETWNVQNRPRYRQVNKSTILEALWKGVINRQQAIEKLQDIGYSSDAATFIVDTFLAGPPTEEKRKLRAEDLVRFTLEQTRDAYLAGRITAEQAIAHLQDMGYTLEGAQLIIEQWNEEAARLPPVLYRPMRELSEEKLAALSVTQTERLFKAYMLSKERAVGHLLDLGYSEETANLLVENWEKTRPPEQPPIEPEKLPTVGALCTALTRGIIDEDSFTNYMKELHYSDAAIAFYIGLSQYAPAISQRDYTRAEILDMYEWGILDYEETVRELVERGYDIEQATNFIYLMLRKLDERNIIEQFGKGCYDLAEALFRYANIGKTFAYGVKSLFAAEVLPLEEALRALLELGFTESEGREYLGI